MDTKRDWFTEIGSFTLLGSMLLPFIFPSAFMFKICFFALFAQLAVGFFLTLIENLSRE